MKKKVAIITCFFFLFSIAIAGYTDPLEENTKVINSNILYVGGDGPNNYTKIQDAINDANDGDTIFVYDESSPYYESINVDKSIALIGENRNTTIIDGKGGWVVINITAEGVTIENFTIQNGEYGGIYVYSNYNCIFHNIITKNGWEGIYLEHSHNNRILCNGITSIDGRAIDIYYSHNNVITSNFIDSNEAGIILMNASHNKIFDNKISNHETGGITIWIGYDNIIKNNNLSNNEIGIYLSSSNNSVFNNSFYRCGIIVDSFHNEIADNTVNGKPLLYLEGHSDEIIEKEAGQIILVNCNNITVCHQNISYTSIGIELLSTKNCNIFNNTFLKCGSSVFLYNSNNNQITKNYCSNSDDAIILWYGMNNEIADNAIKNISYGIHLRASNINYVKGNIITHGEEGILMSGEMNKIINNTIFNMTKEAIWMTSSDLNVIRKNNIGHNKYGIFITGKYKGSLFNLIAGNVIHNNEFGIYIENGYYNLFCNNWFINNDKHVSAIYLDRLILNIWIMNHWDLLLAKFIQ